MLKQLMGLLFFILLQACASSPEKSETLKNVDLNAIARQDPNLLLETSEGEKIVLYQIFTRLFGNTKTTDAPYGTLEENGVGKFNDINEKALQAIRQMGFNHVWYTGVIEHAVLTDYTAFDIPLDDADVVKGRAGSPYAIKDYYDVNPDLAVDVKNRMQEFEALVQRTHEANLKVIIDFVPNHVARAYHSDVKPDGVIDLGADDDTSKDFDPNNNFYYILGEPFKVPEDYNSLGDHRFPTKDGQFEEFPAKATGNNQFTAQPTINDWFETVKLNYGVDYIRNGSAYFNPVPDTWLKMRDILLFWAGKQVDGFRCDMAEMVPVQFWHWVISEIKQQFPDLIFIAEIYNPQEYWNYIDYGKFDFLYDKVQLYDTLKHIMQGYGSTDHLGGIWQFLREKNKNMLRFLENHDEQRIASRFFVEDAQKAMPGMVVTATWHTGPVMVYFGQEVGEPALGVSGFSGDDGRTTIFDYWGIPEHQKWVNEGAYDGGQLSDAQKDLQNFYAKLLQVSSNKAFSEGYFYDLHPHNRHFTQGYTDKVYAFLRFKDEDRYIVVTNFDAENGATFNLKIPRTAMQAMGLPEEQSYQASDRLLSEQTAWFEGKDIVMSEGSYGIPIELQPLESCIFALEKSESGN